MAKKLGKKGVVNKVLGKVADLQTATDDQLRMVIRANVENSREALGILEARGNVRQMESLKKQEG